MARGGWYIECLFWETQEYNFMVSITLCPNLFEKVISFHMGKVINYKVINYS